MAKFGTFEKVDSSNMEHTKEYEPCYYLEDNKLTTHERALVESGRLIGSKMTDTTMRLCIESIIESIKLEKKEGIEPSEILNNLEHTLVNYISKG